MSQQQVTVLGTGTMGRGIAQVAAQHGFMVRVFDAADGQAQRAVATLHDLFDKLASKGKLTADQNAAAKARLHVASNLGDACQNSHVIVEAIFESLEAKQALWKQVDLVAPRSALFGSNTSSIPIAHIATAVADPSRFIGLHFFNPPALVRLLEIVVAPLTSDATVAAARTFGDQLDRQMVVVKDSPGFATSRLGVVLALEAIRMVEAGVASAADIDRALEVGYGHAMGPLRTTDLVGLDVRLAIAETLQRDLGGAQYQPPALLRRLVSEGKLGKKSKQGFYVWE